MAIAGEANIQAARTTYESLMDTALDQARSAGLETSFSQRFNADGNAYELSMGGAVPAFEQWVGRRSWRGFRVLKKTIPIDKQATGVELSREQVVYDTTGLVETKLRQVASDTSYLYEKLVIEKLADNPTGIDGVALMSGSHPYAESGGTWDNQSGNALSFDEFDTARAAMRSLKDEEGEPLDIEPRILLVHPDEERTALEIAQADARPISVATAGAINSGGIGATGITNVYRGTVDVVVSSRWTSGKWALLDPRYAPIALCVWRDPESFIDDDMSSGRRMDDDTFRYGAEADVNCDGFQPWGVYGNL